jgi:hypothetical protein
MRNRSGEKRMGGGGGGGVEAAGSQFKGSARLGPPGESEHIE